MRAIIVAVLVLSVGCGGAAPTIIRGTLGGMHGACQVVDVADSTWNAICQAVAVAVPYSEQLGAGPAVLTPEDAAREVTITIGAE
jgi:hypothetical protein